MENREKYLSFVVPCYNSESYMARCIESLLPGGEDVEIIIIDDGSKDKTGEIADAYQKQYPDLVKVIHKENGGHGSGVNAGLACARGVYFKVVDSDDWLDGTAYQKLLEKNQILLQGGGRGRRKAGSVCLQLCIQSSGAADNAQYGIWECVSCRKNLPLE